jgi:hypothetical protein
MLDSFFASLAGHAGLERVASDRAFAQARNKPKPAALTALNAQLLDLAQARGWMPLWHGLRVVAEDASVLMPATRACHQTRLAAQPDQRLFGLYLPGPELCLHAQLCGPKTGKRQMLFVNLQHLQANDVLVLDRGYPAAWLIALLQQQSIRFCMRCDNYSGFKVVREFLRSGASEAIVTLSMPSIQDAKDDAFFRQAPCMRLTCVGASRKVRILLTNLVAQVFPVEVFGQLYHQRCRIEEAFKCLKHGLKIESGSGLSQQACVVDIAAKVLADNLGALLIHCARGMQERTDRVCIRSHAASLMQRMLTRLLFLPGALVACIPQIIELLRSNLVRRVDGRSRPQPASKNKPHPHLA